MVLGVSRLQTESAGVTVGRLDFSPSAVPRGGGISSFSFSLFFIFIPHSQELQPGDHPEQSGAGERERKGGS